LINEVPIFCSKVVCVILLEVNLKLFVFLVLVIL
jgi:hypothetical protein